MTETTTGGTPAIPSRKWYLLALAIFLLGLGAMGVFLSARLTALGDQLIQVVVPGTVDLKLAEPGSYTIFHERDSVVGGRLYAGDDISGLRVTVRAQASGAEIAVAPVATSSRYSFGGRTGVSAFEFIVREPGTYRLVAAYDDGRARPQAVLAIGHGFLGGLLGTIFGALAFAFGGAAIALFIALRVFFKRRRAP